MVLCSNGHIKFGCIDDTICDLVHDLETLHSLW